MEIRRRKLQLVLPEFPDVANQKQVEILVSKKKAR